MKNSEPEENAHYVFLHTKNISQNINQILCHKGNLNRCPKGDIQIVFSQNTQSYLKSTIKSNF